MKTVNFFTIIILRMVQISKTRFLLWSLLDRQSSGAWKKHLHGLTSLYIACSAGNSALALEQIGSKFNQTARATL